MSIASFEVNLVDLYVLNPNPDGDCSNVPDPEPVLTNVVCSVQPANFGTTKFWDSQNRMVGGYALYFDHDLVWTTVVDNVTVYHHITVQNGVPMESYQFRWYNNLWNSPDVVDPTLARSVRLRILGWGEDTKGIMNMWRADCEQVG